MNTNTILGGVAPLRDGYGRQFDPTALARPAQAPAVTAPVEARALQQPEDNTSAVLLAHANSEIAALTAARDSLQAALDTVNDTPNFCTEGHSPIRHSDKDGGLFNGNVCPLCAALHEIFILQQRTIEPKAEPAVEQGPVELVDEAALSEKKAE